METKKPSAKANSRKTTLLIASLAAGVLFLYPLQMPQAIFFTLGNLPEFLSYGGGALAILEAFTYLLLLCIPVAVIAGVVSFGKGGSWLKLTWIAAFIGAGVILFQQLLLAIRGFAFFRYYSILGALSIFLCLTALVVMVITALHLYREPVTLADAEAGRPPTAASTVAPGDERSLAAAPQQVVSNQEPTLSISATPALDTQKTGFFRMLFSDRGRINRGQFWGYSILVAVLYTLVAGGYIAILSATDRGSFMNAASIGVIILLISSLMLIWITLALTIKRYHDLDKSAWWLLIALIPVIGSLWQFIETGFVAGTPGPNRYGPKP